MAFYGSLTTIIGLDVNPRRRQVLLAFPPFFIAYFCLFGFVTFTVGGLLPHCFAFAALLVLVFASRPLVFSFLFCLVLALVLLSVVFMLAFRLLASIFLGFFTGYLRLVARTAVFPPSACCRSPGIA